MSLAFSSNDAEAISRKIPINESERRDHTFSLDDVYEIPRCIDWIKSNRFSKIALQFPDYLLEDATNVAIELETNTNKEIDILGDTTYGSCCVDEIAALRGSADAIIHYGHACLSPTSRLPVLYVFGKHFIDIQDATNAFKSLFTDVNGLIIILYEVTYSYAVGNLVGNLIEYKNIMVSELDIPGISSESSNVTEMNEDLIQIKTCGRKLCIPKMTNLNDFNIFYIGEQNETLTNFMLSFNHCTFYSYYPLKKLFQLESLDVNKHLRRRYYYIEKTKDAKIIGILVGTLAVSNYMNIIEQLKELIENSGKKSYTLVIGKLNCAKLANFPQIEIFVNVACRESSLIESRELYQPIIIPYELEIALNKARAWTGDYITDFGELLPGAVNFISSPQGKEIDVDVSLVTGKTRSLGLSDDASSQPNTAPILATRDEMKISTIHSQAAGEFLTQLSWRGLEQHLGETAIPEILEGRKGIASAYENELGDKSK
ncbi:Diphthamide biosynthesis protein 2, partial [Stegodyphus mimosarum]